MTDAEKIALRVAALATANEKEAAHRAEREKMWIMLGKSLLALMALLVAPELLATMISSEFSPEAADLVRGLPTYVIQVLALWVTHLIFGKLIDESTNVNLLYKEIIDHEIEIGVLMEGEKNPFARESVYYINGGQIESRRKAARNAMFTLGVISIVFVYTAAAWVSNESHILSAIFHTLVARLIMRDIVIYALRGGNYKLSLVALQVGDATEEQLKRLTRLYMRGVGALMWLLRIMNTEIVPAPGE